MWKLELPTRQEGARITERSTTLRLTDLRERGAAGEEGKRRDITRARINTDSLARFRYKNECCEYQD